MSTRFLRPSFLHDPARVSSASSEAGLTANAPLAASTNKGTLVLRASGTPLAAEALDVLLQTGGSPHGYTVANNGTGAGAAAIWKRTTDTSTQYRGFNDSIYIWKRKMKGPNR